MENEDETFTYTIWTHIEALLNAAWSLLAGEPARKFWKKSLVLVREAEKQLRIALAEVAAGLDVTLPKRRASSSKETKPKAETKTVRTRSFSVMPPLGRYSDYSYTYDPEPLIELKEDHSSRDIEYLYDRIEMLDAVAADPERHARRLALLLMREDTASTELRYLGAGVEIAPDVLAAFERAEPPPDIQDSS